MRMYENGRAENGMLMTSVIELTVFPRVMIQEQSAKLDKYRDHRGV